MKNPEWEKAEATRLAAEESYAKYMKIREENLEKDKHAIDVLNADIDAANKKVRSIPENI